MLNQEVAGSAEPESAESLLTPTAVSRIFAEVFELDSVAVDDDFFQLGGDSLIAATLMSAIEEAFGVSLSISVLLESPSPQALAEAIDEASRERARRILIRVRSEGNGPPIFCVHGTNGESTFPYRMKEALSQERPVYGIRALGLEPGEMPLTSVEALATSYIAAITGVQPSGPYLLLGHCAGSTVVWEMAQKLLRAGKEVAGVVLVDPETDIETAPYLYQTGLAVNMIQGRWLDRVQEIATWYEPDADAEERRRLTHAAMLCSIGTYTPKPLPCPVLFVCSAERREILLRPPLGYPRLLSDVTYLKMTCDHYNIFNANIGELAEALEGFFDRVAPMS